MKLTRGDIIEFRYTTNLYNYPTGLQRRKITAVHGNFVEVYHAYHSWTCWLANHNGTLVPAERNEGVILSRSTHTHTNRA